MKGLCFVTDEGLRASEAEHIHSHRELVFQASVTDEPSLRVQLPLETGLSLEFLSRLAANAAEWDFFGEAYLTFEGADLDYAYTFAEVVQELGLTLTVSQEADCLVFGGC